MTNLWYKLENEIMIMGKAHVINLFFDNVIRLFDMFNDDGIDEGHKIDIAFRMLIISHEDIQYELTLEEKFDVVRTIMETFILPDGYEERSHTTKEKLYDLSQDSAYIYSSFMQEYNIDLIQQFGKMQWEVFNSLLQGMRDTTKIKEIMNIRGSKIPAVTKHNKDEVRRLREQKKFYALKKTQQETEEQLNEMFKKLTQR